MSVGPGPALGIQGSGSHERLRGPQRPSWGQRKASLEAEACGASVVACVAEISRLIKDQ